MKTEPLKNLQAKVEADVYDLFERSLEASDCQTRGKFMELILEKYLNPKIEKVQVSKTEDVARISELEHALAETANMLNEAKETHNAEVIRLDGLLTLEKFKTENAAPVAELAENELVISVFPAQLKEIQDLRALSLEKNREELSQSAAFSLLFDKGYIKQLPKLWT